MNASNGVDGALLPPRRERVRAAYVLGVLALSALGFGLRHEALRTGFVADDYAQIGMLEGEYLVDRSPLNLFNFSDGSAAEGERLMQGGFYPWWTHPEIRLSMLRPLASAMIWLDWTLFGNRPLLYHLHSLAWWLAMLGVIATLFYRLLPIPVALMAFAFLVLDEAHGVPLAWIANRCALVSTALSLYGVLTYIEYRERGRPIHLWSTLLLVTLAFAFGEYTICSCGYVAAYELFARRDAWAKRLQSLWPVATPALIYLSLRELLGAGPQYSGVYIGPGADLAAFVQAVLVRIPVLYADLSLGFRAEFWTFGFPWTHALLERGAVGGEWLWSPEPWRRVHVLIGLGGCALVALLFATTPSSGNARNLRWLFAGSFFAVLPVTASFPSSRLLLVPLVGFTPMLAGFVRHRFAMATSGGGNRLRRGAMLVVAAVIGLYHTITPAWLTRSETLGLYYGATAIRKAVLEMQAGPELPQQHVVVLTALEGGTSMYIPLTRMRHGLTAPRTCWTLSLAQGSHLLTRDSERSFTLLVLDGYTMLSTAPELLLRAPSVPLRGGDQIDLGGMRVTVLSLLRGKPVHIRAEFDVPLEHPSLHFVNPTLDGIVRFQMPPVGGVAQLPPPVIPPLQM